MKKQFKFIGRHLVLLLLAVIWLIPIVWLVVTSFSGYKGINTAHFFPQTWSLDNYVALFLRPDSVVQYKKWFANTLVIAIFTALISTIFVLMVAYTMSCMRFKGRKQLMSFGIILNMFPGVFEGKSTGTPIGFEVRNQNQHSQDYENMRCLFRPSHADFTYQRVA